MGEPISWSDVVWANTDPHDDPDVLVLGVLLSEAQSPLVREVLQACIDEEMRLEFHDDLVMTRWAGVPERLRNALAPVRYAELVKNNADGWHSSRNAWCRMVRILWEEVERPYREWMARGEEKGDACERDV